MGGDDDVLIGVARATEMLVGVGEGDGIGETGDGLPAGKYGSVMPIGVGVDEGGG
jgi:hypothetical protein